MMFVDANVLIYLNLGVEEVAKFLKSCLRSLGCILMFSSSTRCFTSRGGGMVLSLRIL